MNNTCVCCGAVIPEGRQVCPNCEARAYDPDEFFRAEHRKRGKKKRIVITVEVEDLT